MSCTIKFCYKDFCVVIIRFAQSEFAQAIGYKGDVSSMNLNRLSAEPASKISPSKPDVPPTAQISAEVGVGDKRATNIFQIDYDNVKGAYVWHDTQAAESWFVEVNKRFGNLADVSGAFTFEGFDQY